MHQRWQRPAKGRATRIGGKARVDEGGVILLRIRFPGEWTPSMKASWSDNAACGSASAVIASAPEITTVFHSWMPVTSPAQAPLSCWLRTKLSWTSESAMR